MKKEDNLGTACSTNAGDENCVYDTAGSAKRKETTRRRWVDYINIDVREWVSSYGLNYSGSV